LYRYYNTIVIIYYNVSSEKLSGVIEKSIVSILHFRALRAIVKKMEKTIVIFYILSKLTKLLST